MWKESCWNGRCHRLTAVLWVIMLLIVFRLVWHEERKKGSGNGRLYTPDPHANLAVKPSSKASQKLREMRM